MLSPGAETVARMIGWTFLPDFGSRILLQTYRNLQVTLLPRLGFKSSVPPPVGSPAYALQQRICFSLVILFYLLYTSVQAYVQAPPNFYELLGVSPDVEEGPLKTAFRNFARVNHPDKVGPAGEARFIAARDAFDTLKSSTKRFAYDRFGPDVIGWASECTTVSDYLERGMMASSGFYIATIVVMLLYAIFGQSGFGAFWRYHLFFTIACSELLLILSPDIWILKTIFPSRVVYQHIRLLRQIFISLSFAITRIGPAMLPSFSGLGPTQGEWEQERTALYMVVKQVTEIAARLDREISRMIQLEIRAAHGQVEEYAPSQPIPEGLAATAPAPPTTPGVMLAGTSRPGSYISQKPGGNKHPQAEGHTSQSTSAPIAGLGGVELDDGVMRRLNKEVVNLVLEKNIKRHPMLARIWRDGVMAGRAAYEREKEERLREARKPSDSLSQSDATAVEILPRDLSGPSSSTKPGPWKQDYIRRRARSEDYFTAPSSFREQLEIRDTPPPTSLRHISEFSSEGTPSTGSSRNSTPEVPDVSSSSLLNVQREELSRMTLSPGPEFQANETLSMRRLSNEAFPPSIPPPGSPPPTAEGRFDVLRSRSMSLVS